MNCRKYFVSVYCTNFRRKYDRIMEGYGVNADKVDIELLMPIDRKLATSDKFTYKEKLKIVNAVVAKYKVYPNGLQDACNELNRYIMEHKLQPITVGYNVTKKTDMLNPENTEIDVYVGISPNIL